MRAAISAISSSAARRASENRPLFILDLGAPRDFAPGTDDVDDNVFLYDIDDLEATCERNRTARAREIRQAQLIIDEETERFMHDIYHRATGPIVKRLREEWHDIRREEGLPLVRSTPTGVSGIIDSRGRILDRARLGLGARGVIDAPDGPAHDTLRQLVDAPQHDLWWWIVTLLVTVAAPTLEEIIHRGFFQTALIRATGKPWLGIALASALFTLVHAAAVPFYAMPALFVFSLALGWAFERTGRLAVPIVMHAAFNALNIAAATAAG